MLLAVEMQSSRFVNHFVDIHFSVLPTHFPCLPFLLLDKEQMIRRARLCRAGSISQPHQDPFSVLGLTRHASKDEVKKAYRKMAKALHPDLKAAEIAKSGSEASSGTRKSKWKKSIVLTIY